MNTFGDLRGTFAAVERINSVLAEAQIDEALAFGLEREMQQKEVHDENYKLFFLNGHDEKIISRNMHYMSALKSASNLYSLARSGDVHLEGIHCAVLFIMLRCITALFCLIFCFLIFITLSHSIRPCLSIILLTSASLFYEMLYQASGCYKVYHYDSNR